jgi:hypothetical protein
MTLLEHSLAFAEAEHRAKEKTFEIIDPTHPLGKRQVRSQKNVAPQVFYIMPPMAYVPDKLRIGQLAK